MKRKPYKKQDDRLLKQLSYAERRRQVYYRRMIYKELNLTTV
jgi:hypothetical protein